MSYDLIAIGSSLGGLAATRAIFSTISEDLQLPIVLIQHREQRAESSTEYLLRNMLRRFTRRKVEEVEDKTKLQRGCIYLAPADYHLLVERDYLCLSADDPEAFARPSIDVAFDSAARNYGHGLIAVVLTGSSADGADGAASVEKRGGLVIVQEPMTAENATMPRAALAKLVRAKIIKLEEIGPYLSAIAGDHGGGHSASRLAR